MTNFLSSDSESEINIDYSPLYYQLFDWIQRNELDHEDCSSNLNQNHELNSQSGLDKTIESTIIKENSMNQKTEIHNFAPNNNSTFFYNIFFIVSDIYVKFKQSMKSEVILRLYHPQSQKSTFIVSLTQRWLNIDIHKNDPVFVLADFQQKEVTVPVFQNISSQHIQYEATIDNHNGFLILWPLSLVSPTELATASFCLRKAILLPLVPTIDFETNELFVKGNISHQLVQDVLTGSIRTDGLEKQVGQLIEKNMENAVIPVTNKQMNTQIKPIVRFAFELSKNKDNEEKDKKLAEEKAELIQKNNEQQKIQIELEDQKKNERNHQLELESKKIETEKQLNQKQIELQTKKLEITKSGEIDTEKMKQFEQEQKLILDQIIEEQKFIMKQIEAQIELQKQIESQISKTKSICNGFEKQLLEIEQEEKELDLWKTQSLNLPPYGCDTVRIEESMISVIFGLVGKSDVTLHDSKKDKYFPLELKTHASEYEKAYHSLQVTSYVLMMKENYKEKAEDYGMLFYMENEKSFKIEPTMSNNQSLTILRNSILENSIYGINPIVQKDRKCDNCEAADVCQFFNDIEDVELNQTCHSMHKFDYNSSSDDEMPNLRKLQNDSSIIEGQYSSRIISTRKKGFQKSNEIDEPIPENFNEWDYGGDLSRNFTLPIPDYPPPYLDKNSPIFIGSDDESSTNNSLVKQFTTNDARNSQRAPQDYDGLHTSDSPIPEYPPPYFDKNSPIYIGSDDELDSDDPYLKRLKLNDVLNSSEKSHHDFDDPDYLQVLKRKENQIKIENMITRKRFISRNTISRKSINTNQSLALEQVQFFRSLDKPLLNSIYKEKYDNAKKLLSPPHERERSGSSLTNLIFIDMDDCILLFQKEKNISQSKFRPFSKVIFTRNGVPPILSTGMIIQIINNDVSYIEIKTYHIEEFGGDFSNLCIDIIGDNSYQLILERRSLINFFVESGRSFKILSMIFISHENSRVFNSFDLPQMDGLNKQQKEIVQNAIKAKDYCIISGCKNSGKKTIITFLLDYFAEKHRRVLHVTKYVDYYFIGDATQVTELTDVKQYETYDIAIIDHCERLPISLLFYDKVRIKKYIFIGDLYQKVSSSLYSYVELNQIQYLQMKYNQSAHIHRLQNRLIYHYSSSLYRPIIKNLKIDDRLNKFEDNFKSWIIPLLKSYSYSIIIDDQHFYSEILVVSLIAVSLLFSENNLKSHLIGIMCYNKDLCDYFKDMIAKILSMFNDSLEFELNWDTLLQLRNVLTIFSDVDSDQQYDYLIVSFCNSNTVSVSDAMVSVLQPKLALYLVGNETMRQKNPFFDDLIKEMQGFQKIPTFNEAIDLHLFK